MCDLRKKMCHQEFLAFVQEDNSLKKKKKLPADEPPVRFDLVMFKPAQTNYTIVCSFGSTNGIGYISAGSLFPLMSVL